MPDGAARIHPGGLSALADTWLLDLEGGRTNSDPLSTPTLYLACPAMKSFLGLAG